MANNNSNQASANRVQTKFLVKPKYEGTLYPCYESGFNATRQESIRVRRMEDMRQEIAEYLECSVECIDYSKLSILNPQLYHEFKDYLGKQPLFFLQERFAPVCPGYEWNGFLLFSIRGKDDARKVAIAHKDELHIILSFDDPDADLYYILVDTETGGGTLEEFQKWQEDVRDMCIRPYFRKPLGHALGHYSRALTPAHYDIVNLDALFGTPVSDEGLGMRDEGTSLHPTPSSELCSHGACETTLHRLVSFFGHLIGH